MIDIMQSKVTGQNKETWYKLTGTSTDTKPTGEFPAGSGHTIVNGSRLFETDTEIRYELQSDGWKAVGQEPVDNTELAGLIDRSIKTITIPNGVTSIGDNTFSGCNSLTDVTIPEGVTNIGNNSFSGCNSLTEITIPSSVTRIGSYAFNGTTSLTNIVINKPQDSIAGSPWGATYAEVVWTG